ncbi:MAG: hypothetical protein ACKON8_05575 [Planctomycetota bacterium]
MTPSAIGSKYLSSRIPDGAGIDSIVLTKCIFAGPTSVVTNAGDDTFGARGCAFTSIFFDAGLADDAFVCEPSTNETTPDGFVGFKILSPVV